MRKRNTVLRPTPSKTVPNLYYSIHRLPRGFRQLEVETVFPSAPKEPEANVYAIVTFQKLEPWVEPDAANDAEHISAGEPVCLTAGGGCCGTGDMIEFTAGAFEFKDESRDTFFNWMNRVRAELCEQLSPEPKSTDRIPLTAQALIDRDVNAALKSSCGTVAPGLWMDWVDPATGLACLGDCGPSTYSEVDGIEQLLAYEMIHVGTAGGGCRMISHPKFGLDCYPATGFVSCGDVDKLVEVLRML